MPKKILIVGSQHGDETLGIELFEYIQKEHSDLTPHLKYICANPEAVRAAKRFLDVDMNRSYVSAPNPHKHEEVIAAKLLNHINDLNYDLVLDVHTTTTKVGLCLIMAPNTRHVERFANASSITNMVVIPADISAHSLIGNISNAISLECTDTLSKQRLTLEELAQFVRRLVYETQQAPSKKYIYYVDGFIDAAEQPAHELRNFTKTPDGRYPVLSGGKPGRTYRGFWASRRESLTI